MQRIKRERGCLGVLEMAMIPPFVETGQGLGRRKGQKWEMLMLL
jgi:hypothetical protein